ncbi:purine nucleoside phosphorylase LACC1-like [Hyla sarda]|uniref:purine nucleoside phosphorylase LACC1-like n=1 Tax=Hyla sarda TaxID=327740 RepID=UPI0024C3F832|nr:purine nucleoside phosphorylase LACC1-like [Hyla sarda]
MVVPHTAPPLPPPVVDTKPAPVYALTGGVLFSSSTEKMAEAVLIDMFSLEFTSHHCIKQFLDAAMKIVLLKSGTAASSIYIIYCQSFGCDNNDARDVFLHAIRAFQGLRKHVELISTAGVTATLYNVKQKLDEKNISRVQIILPKSRTCLMKAFIDRLFTQVYAFDYELLELSYCETENASQPSKDQTFTEKQLELVECDIQIFLGTLPGKGEMTILKSPLIPENTFNHGFTTRCGGVSYIPELSSLNLYSSNNRKDSPAVVSENLRRLSMAVGFNHKNFHLVKAAHASDVWIMGKNEPDSYDGIVTNQKGVTVAAPGADCIPMLFSDPVNKAFGAAHSGWKGTLLGISMATVNAMISEYGSDVKDILVVLGPSVGPCCFTLTREEAKAFYDIDQQCVRQLESSNPNVDIRKATRILLERGGILPTNIEDKLALCTSCNQDLFFSHTRDGENFGTQIGFIAVKN